MDKQSQLDKIAQEITATKGGPMASYGSNPVPGEGNPDAKIMFIGEAPGFHENEQKRPFVGVSGKLLRKTMEENGFKPEEVFITNIVKFRPPQNRDPLPAEIGFFKLFLDKQIEIIKPKIIVTVGRFSMYKFFGEGISIGKIHGQPRKVGNYFVFPMFHPAAALRAGDMMKMFLEDFKKLKEFLELLDEPKVDSPKTESTKQIELL